MKKIKKERKSLLFAFFVILLVLVMLFCFLFCKKNVIMIDAVTEYLSGADFKGNGQGVQKGDEIVVDYIGRLKDGTVFDTSIQSIAIASNNYNEHRNYDEGLSFIVGAGNMIVGFDRGVEGMKVGQTKTIEIHAIDAYGERDEKNVITVSKSQLQSPNQYKEGDIFYAPNGQAVSIYKVSNTEIMLDMNHELAGKTLIFDITIKEIK